jgi:uncharacterized protein YpmB
MWVFAVIGGVLFVVIVIIYIIVMRTCCKKSDSEYDETIEDITNSQDLKNVVKEQTLLS